MVLLRMYVNKMFLPKKMPQGHNLYPRKCYFEINTKIYLPLTLTLDLEIYLEEISYSSTLINQFKHCDGVTGIKMKISLLALTELVV